MLYIVAYSAFFKNDLMVTLWNSREQAKKATARSEREATEADQQIWKMQVEAADNAEETKKRLDKSM